MFSRPTCVPIMMAPMLLDFSSTSCMVIVPYPWCDSWITRPGRTSTPLPVGISVSGRRLVVSSAAASVTTLNTEPGSNGTDAPRSNRAIGIVALLRRLVGIVSRIIRQRENLSRIRIHHDRGAAARVFRLDARLQFPLRNVLHPLVDGERQRDARLRRRIHVRIEAAVLHVHHEPLGTIVAPQHLIERPLDAGRALFILIDGAQNVGRHLAFRIVALALGVECDPVEMHRLQAVGLERIDSAASPT